MKTLSIAVALVILGASTAAHASESGDPELLKRLGEAKHSLADAIKQAEKTDGTAISAKLEVENGKLWLSVYTAKAGRDADAEHNTLEELKGEANAAEWKPTTEVFADNEHLTRSAMHLTVMQLGKSTLEELIKKASTGQKGTAYSAIPQVKKGKPVLTVAFATGDGKSAVVDVDVQSGKPLKP